MMKLRPLHKSLWSPPTTPSVDPNIQEKNTIKTIAKAAQTILTANMKPNLDNLNTPNRLIIPIASFKEAFPVLKILNRNALVLFDIDGVISIPKEPLLHPKVFRQHRRVVEETRKSLSKEKYLVLKHLFAGSPSRLVEDDLPAIILKLQKKQICTLGFTNAVPGKIHENLPQFYKIRERCLKDLGVDFSLGNFDRKIYTDLNPVNGSYPTLIHGILYVCGSNNTKGNVLARFLHENPEINTIVHFEDQKENLDSEIDSLEASFLHINFIGFLYNGVESLTYVPQDEKNFQAYLNKLIAKVKNHINI